MVVARISISCFVLHGFNSTELEGGFRGMRLLLLFTRLSRDGLCFMRPDEENDGLSKGHNVQGSRLKLRLA